MGNFLNSLIDYLFIIPCVLIALTFHECAHGWAANKLGDPTAKNLGRLTLNPLKHVDPIGALCMIFFRFGWAKPVPINSRNFRKPRRDMALTALAGPAMNVLLSLASALLLVIVEGIFVLTSPATLQPTPFQGAVLTLLWYFHYLNLSLAIFNLIPIAPLDGSRFVYLLLPPKLYWGLMKYERYIMYGFLALLFLLSRVGISPIASVVSPLSEWILNRFFGLAQTIVNLFI